MKQPCKARLSCLAGLFYLYASRRLSTFAVVLQCCNACCVRSPRQRLCVFSGSMICGQRWGAWRTYQFLIPLLQGYHSSSLNLFSKSRIRAALSGRTSSYLLAKICVLSSGKVISTTALFFSLQSRIPTVGFSVASFTLRS